MSHSFFKLPGIFILAFALIGCNPEVGPEERPSVEETITSPGPSVEAGTQPAGTATIMPVLTGRPQTAEPQPTRVVLGSPPVNPTRLPEPHIVRVLDWELVSAESGVLCSGCAADQVVVAAPPGLGIAVIRIYTKGSVEDTAAIDTDLAFSNRVECRGKPAGEFCGLIFGQVSGGKITLRPVISPAQTIPCPT